MTITRETASAADLATLAAGFPDPTADAQVTFRLVLDAMARPGRIMTVGAVPGHDRPLSRAACSVMLALADHDTAVWLDRAAAPALPYLRFHTGATVAGTPDRAAFAVIGDATAMPALDRFALGSDAYPDRSTTLVIEVDGLSGGQDGRGVAWRLDGPGIDGSRLLRVTGLPVGFVVARAALAPLYPRGIDIILTCGDRLVALPRTTRIIQTTPVTQEG
ncbi:carbon-phosphorus lyase [Tistrella bauzanensis]|uniref:Carbon-phosphorus lyase n=1 Tax=Tistrella bauzanensis TaxID=657419 RepID=A0ABQ1I931_9PROT|nr:phosphonate C-P lyase system protein PhnH [Tistrella bauzanensis]GGB24689.1 carbon-phosphorus lyase [Tistrella bauzanensis]